MKLIALDVGTKRIGVAKADSKIRIATPYDAIEVDGNELVKIASLSRAWEIEAFVIGLPRNSQGEETEQSRYVRLFAAELKKQIPQAKIAFQDESLTSVEAEKRLKKRKKGFKKGDIDSEAATIILQDFLESRMDSKPSSRTVSVKNQSIRSKTRNGSRKGFIVFLIVAILLAGCGVGSFVFYNENLRAVYSECVSPNEDRELRSGERWCEDDELWSSTISEFTIGNGESISAVATRLRNENLIRNALVFQIYFRLNHADETIKTGTYSISQSMSVGQIANLLISGDNSNVFSLTILPGWNKFDIIDALVSTGYNYSEVDAAIHVDYSDREYAWIFEGKPADTSLEGYLYGETHEFYKGASVFEIIDKILAEFAKQLETNNIKAGFEAHGLNLYQGITLASIVQKESNRYEDSTKVAQVFYNRLAAGMTLGSDVTVQYAIDLVDRSREVYTDNATALSIDSPYNTRRNTGLTPGPISNPSISTLIATATPDESMSEYYYFLTGDDGVMYYSRTDAEHQQNIVNYCAVLCNVSL